MTLAAAAEALAGASALLVTAGAGMGVDSGLPDFRGNEGFWRAYPPYAKLGLPFSAMANPAWFERDPAFAWGFYGHRLALYRRTVPHEGFSILQRLGARCAEGLFVFTSNVDGQFQRAGFDRARIAECHGALDHLQCTEACGVGIVTADGYQPDIDEETFRAREPLPRCPRCSALMRPNVLMFGDGEWESARSDAQERRLGAFLDAVRGPLVVVECGAGTAIPTVRMLGEELASRRGARLIRINVREPEVPAGQIGLEGGAKAVLTELERRLSDGR